MRRPNHGNLNGAADQINLVESNYCVCDWLYLINSLSLYIPVPAGRREKKKLNLEQIQYESSIVEHKPSHVVRIYCLTRDVKQ